MSWGAIYTQSWWGRAIKEDFGEIYEEVANPVISNLLSALKDRADFYENEDGTKDLLNQLKDCTDE